MKKEKSWYQSESNFASLFCQWFLYNYNLVIDKDTMYWKRKDYEPMRQNMVTTFESVSAQKCPWHSNTLLKWYSMNIPLGLLWDISIYRCLALSCQASSAFPTYDWQTLLAFLLGLMKTILQLLSQWSSHIRNKSSVFISKDFVRTWKLQQRIDTKRCSLLLPLCGPSSFSIQVFQLTAPSSLSIYMVSKLFSLAVSSTLSIHLFCAACLVQFAQNAQNDKNA